MARQSADRYVPGTPPSTEDAAEVLAWALRELEAASIVINNVAAGQVEVCYVAPEKPRTGWIRYADGIGWDPGSGAGFYGFREGQGWRFLG
jgi:hypothetical protein